MHSSPKEPEPENKSKTSQFSILNFINLECSIILKIDSYTKSFKGLV